MSSFTLGHCQLNLVFSSRCNISHLKIRGAEDLENKVYKELLKKRVLCIFLFKLFVPSP